MFDHELMDIYGMLYLVFIIIVKLNEVYTDINNLGTSELVCSKLLEVSRWPSG